jgi:hypothetical protein
LLNKTYIFALSKIQMKKIFLLFIVFVSLGVNAQTDSLNVSTNNDSLSGNVLTDTSDAVIQTNTTGVNVPDSSEVIAPKIFFFNEAWYFSVGAGTSVFLGDVSPVQKLTLKKNTNEYKFGCMFRLGKKIIPAVDVNLEFNMGTLGGKKTVNAQNQPMDLTFTGDYIALIFNARVDVLKLLKTTRDLPFSFFGRIGAGPLYYHALKTRLSTGEYLESAGYIYEGQTKHKSIQTTVMPVGFGMAYNFSYNFRIEANVDLFNAFTDNLDAQTGNTGYNDKFVIIGGALVYGFDWNNFQPPQFH